MKAAQVRCPECGHLIQIPPPIAQEPVEILKPPKYSQLVIRRGGGLPHWEMEGGTYFVTYRLADSLPKDVLEGLEVERRELERRAETKGQMQTREARTRIWVAMHKRTEKILDAGLGSCVLADPGNARIVAESLRFFDGERYVLHTWCVMPNHVHVVFRLLARFTLSRVMHSWKSYTATKINRAVGRTGRLWQGEYFDRLIRNDKEFDRAVKYVVDNPCKAGLEEWEWVWFRGQDAPATAD
jgi:REP element-mobilizing transposase RayT